MNDFITKQELEKALKEQKEELLLGFREQAKQMLDEILGIILVSAKNVEKNAGLHRNTIPQSVETYAKDFMTHKIFIKAEVVNGLVTRSQGRRKK
jgi:hypothetical protein